MAAVACAIVTLAGCAAAPAPAPTTATPTTAPVFASDEEALAAATEAYANYLRVSDEILMDGGDRPERIRDVTTPEMAKSEIDGYIDAKARQLRSTGGSTFSNLQIQSLSVGGEAEKSVVTAYVCSDVSVVDVIDATGQSVVPPDRPDRTPFEVTFDLAPSGPPHLVVARAAVWDGAGVCS